MSYVWSKCTKDDFLFRPWSAENPECLCKRELYLNEEHKEWRVWPKTPIHIRKVMVEAKLFIVVRPNFPSILADGVKKDLLRQLRYAMSTVRPRCQVYDQLDLLYSMIDKLYTANEVKLERGNTERTQFRYDW